MTRRSSAVIMKEWELIGWTCKVRSRKFTGYRLLTGTTVTQQQKAIRERLKIPRIRAENQLDTRA